MYIVTEDSELVYRTDLDAANKHIEKLETALRKIAKGLPESGSIYEMTTIARVALAQEK